MSRARRTLKANRPSTLGANPPALRLLCRRPVSTTQAGRVEGFPFARQSPPSRNPAQSRSGPDPMRIRCVAQSATSGVNGATSGAQHPGGATSGGNIRGQRQHPGSTATSGVNSVHLIPLKNPQLRRSEAHWRFRKAGESAQIRGFSAESTLDLLFLAAGWPGWPLSRGGWLSTTKPQMYDVRS
jgi:hypothetical protein